MVVTDLYQHRLFAKTPGEWETVYVRTPDEGRGGWGLMRCVDPIHGLCEDAYGEGS
jgi:hypothetical protein